MSDEKLTIELSLEAMVWLRRFAGARPADEEESAEVWTAARQALASGPSPSPVLPAKSKEME